MRRVVVAMVGLSVLVVVVAGSRFLVERYQRPTFPAVIELDGFTFVSEDSASGEVPDCVHGPAPHDVVPPTPLGSLDVFREWGVSSVDGGGVVETVLGAWRGEVRSGQGEGVFGLGSNAAPNGYQPGWSQLAVKDNDCWVAYYLT